LKKQIAGALVASMLMVSVPGRADDARVETKAATSGAESAQLRDSIARVLAASPLTESEQADLETRRAVLRTDPVASGGGGILMSLIATAASIGLTIYLLKKTKESLPTPTMAGR